MNSSMWNVVDVRALCGRLPAPGLELVITYVHRIIVVLPLELLFETKKYKIMGNSLPVIFRTIVSRLASASTEYSILSSQWSISSRASVLTRLELVSQTLETVSK